MTAAVIDVKSITLLDNASATGDWKLWPGGSGVIEIDGTFPATDARLQFESKQSAAIDYDATQGVFTVEGAYPFFLHPCRIRIQLNGGSGSGMYAHAIPALGPIVKDLPVTVELSAADIQIGAVELKNSTTDTRANVLAASTAAAATDTPLVVALHPSSPLGAGTAAIGKLAANSGVDIGDVTLTAGSAIVGQVGVDQTTPGTTNAVAVISGQAGIAGGTGVDGATVPRVSLATNVALPAGTNAIGKLSANSGVDIGDVDILSIAAGDNNIGNVDVVTLPALPAGTNNIGDVDVLSIAAGANVIGKVGIDQTTPGTTNLVAVTSQGYSAAVTLTRTADTNAYAANDVVGAATGSTAALTFASMGPSAGRIMITSISLEIDATAVISGETSYLLYLYNVTPPSALGDNAAFDLPSGDRASFLGYVNLGTPVDLGSTLFVQTTGVNLQVKLAGTSLFGYLVTVGAYTPTSARVHVITLNAVAL